VLATPVDAETLRLLRLAHVVPLRGAFDVDQGAGIDMEDNKDKAMTNEELARALKEQGDMLRLLLEERTAPTRPAEKKAIADCGHGTDIGAIKQAGAAGCPSCRRIMGSAFAAMNHTGISTSSRRKVKELTVPTYTGDAISLRPSKRLLKAIDALIADAIKQGKPSGRSQVVLEILEKWRVSQENAGGR
jgi:hypothetical protein